MCEQLTHTHTHTHTHTKEERICLLYLREIQQCCWSSLSTVLNLRIQPITILKYSKKVPESSKKYNLNLACAGIYISFIWYISTLEQQRNQGHNSYGIKNLTKILQSILQVCISMSKNSVNCRLCSTMYVFIEKKMLL